MENIIREILSHVCDIIPEGCTLIVKPGRIMLVDDDLHAINGTINVAREIVGQATEHNLEYFKEL